MRPHKKYLRKPWWDWAPPNSLCPMGVYRGLKSRKQWLSTVEIDAIDSRDTLVYCTLRARDCRKMPDPWDDLSHSRGYYVRCWKDQYKKKRQWL